MGFASTLGITKMQLQIMKAMPFLPTDCFSHFVHTNLLLHIHHALNTSTFHKFVKDDNMLCIIKDTISI